MIYKPQLWQARELLEVVAKKEQSKITVNKFKIYFHLIALGKGLNKLDMTFYLKWF